MVNLHRVVTLDLASVATDEFHAQTSGNHLTLVAILEALVLSALAGFVFKLSPLRSPMCFQSTVGRLTVGHVDPLLEVGDERWVLTEGIERLGGRISSSLSLPVDPRLGALEVAFAGRGLWAVRVGCRRPSQ